MCCLHEVYNENGSFGGYSLTIQNACPTVKAFHRMNLNQNKCLNSSTASNMAAKVANPIKNGRKQGRLFYDRISLFWNANKNFRVAGKN